MVGIYELRGLFQSMILQPKCIKTQFSCRTVTTELLLKKKKRYFLIEGNCTLTKVVSRVYKHNGNTERYLRIMICIYSNLLSSFLGKAKENLGLATAIKTQFVSASNIRYICTRDGQHVATPNNRSQQEETSFLPIPQSSSQPSHKLTPSSPK